MYLRFPRIVSKSSSAQYKSASSSIPGGVTVVSIINKNVLPMAKPSYISSQPNFGIQSFQHLATHLRCNIIHDKIVIKVVLNTKRS